MTFWLIRKPFFMIFTDDPLVLEQIYSVSAVAAIGIFPDYWQAMMNGCIRALNMQMFAMKYNLIAYWIVNMGFIKLLAFYYDF